MRACIRLRKYGSFVVVAGFVLSACAARVTPYPAMLVPEEKHPVVIGFVDVRVHGPVTRIAPPYITFLELLNRETRERIFLTIQAPDSSFYLHLVPGEYVVTRVQINEAGFRGMAHLHHAFTVTDHPMQYLGHWHFVLTSPTTMRRLELSIEADVVRAATDLAIHYPEVPSQQLVSTLPVPLASKTRLYEITPYPRMWWYVRNPPT